MSDADTTRVTYVELARARGITVAAARRLTQRHKWPKQIGNDGFTHVVVPTSMLAAWDGDTYDDGKVDSADLPDDAYDDAYVDAYDDTRRPRGAALSPAMIGAIADAWADLVGDATADSRRAVRALEETVVSLREQLATERLLRAEDKERADRAQSRAQDAEGCVREAENRVREAERRMREAQEQLEAEMIEHRRVVSLLSESLAARRSWWPWRRRT